MKIEKHPSGSRLFFADHNHLYKTDDSRVVSFISVTTLINRFFPKFDFNQKSADYAKKHGLVLKDVRDDWSEKGRTGREIGNICHNYADTLITKHKNTIGSPRFIYIKKKVRELMKTFKEIRSEYMIANMNLAIAGTVDIVAQSPKNTILIADWKTNKSIDMYSPWGNALYPIEHIGDTNYWKYALQLNIYKFILKSEWYFPKHKKYIMRMYHVKEDGLVEYKIPDLSKEVKAMLKEI